MNKKIFMVINDWDPVCMFPLAPKDEYIREIELIEKYLNNNSKVTVDEFAFAIYKIFLKYFGAELFKKSIVDCREVASKILSSL